MNAKVRGTAQKTFENLWWWKSQAGFTTRPHHKLFPMQAMKKLECFILLETTVSQGNTYMASVCLFGSDMNN